MQTKRTLNSWMNFLSPMVLAPLPIRLSLIRASMELRNCSARCKANSTATWRVLIVLFRTSEPGSSSILPRQSNLDFKAKSLINNTEDCYEHKIQRNNWRNTWSVRNGENAHHWLVLIDALTTHVLVAMWADRNLFSNPAAIITGIDFQPWILINECADALAHFGTGRHFGWIGDVSAQGTFYLDRRIGILDNRTMCLA